MMIQCSKCKETKQTNEFAYRDKKSEILRKQCKSCLNKRKLEWTKLNIEKRNATLIKQREKLKVICSICGNKFMRNSNNYECSIKCRILANIDKDNLTNCWNWKGLKSNSGYGKITINSKTKLVHRMTYEIFIAPFQSNLYVCHKCDNPSCCNPSHLFLGTPKDNAQDKINKNRHCKRYFVTHKIEDVKEVINLRENLGYSFLKIAIILKISLTSVYRYYKHRNEYLT